MKKIFFFLLFVPLVSFGQSMNEALDFLKLNISNWACEKVAHGTLIERISFSYNYNFTKLIIKTKLPEYSETNGYSVNEIELSKILRIEAESNSAKCAGIRIILEPFGIQSYVISRNGNISVSKSKMNEFFIERGWVNESIRIKNDYSFYDRSERIKKALEFMAVKNGAILKESYF